MERESFVFYQSFYKALNKLDATTYKKIMNAICEYGFTGFISTELTDIESVIFELIKPQLDANNKRYENGCKAYKSMIQFAQKNGVKGVRTGLRKATILKKIHEAGLEFEA